ncbi:MAG: 50S ribosomal protein L25 [Candidatus Sungbacteria bacterium]|nr:50S ribosomal protein L25 [Candidatus Sungbacteria bacterium]
MITLEAEKRTLLGKSVKALRRRGLLPAVVYGGKVKTESIAVPTKSFKKVFKEAGESTLVSLVVNGKSLNVLIHDVSIDPLTEAPLHADFLAVQMDKELRTKVLLEFIGESPAVKNEAGVLVKVMHEVEIAALPKDLPHQINVDLSRLEKLNDRLTLRDIEAPPGVKFLVDPEEVIVLVEPPRTEEELKALETAEPAAIVEVMTEQEAKKKADEETKAAAGEVVEEEKKK